MKPRQECYCTRDGEQYLTTISLGGSANFKLRYWYSFAKKNQLHIFEKSKNTKIKSSHSGVGAWARDVGARPPTSSFYYWTRPTQLLSGPNTQPHATRIQLTKRQIFSIVFFLSFMEFPNPKQQPTNKGSTRRYACTEGDGRVGDECALALRAPCLYSACLSTVSLPCMLPEALRLLSDDEKPVRTLQYYPRLLVDAPPVMLFPLSSDVRLVRPAPALAFLTRSRCL